MRSPHFTHLHSRRTAIGSITRLMTASGLATLLKGTHVMAFDSTDLEKQVSRALDVLAMSVEKKQVRAASLFVQQKDQQFQGHFGAAKSEDASYLLGSISKPIALTALMRLYDQELFQLDDPVQKHLPEFVGGDRSRITVRHLLTHVSGLPDQLPNNAQLRASHAKLSDFVAGAMKVDVGFEPGTRYEYSSMGILLAAEIAQRLSGLDIRRLVNETVIAPLGMQNSALGKGRLRDDQMMQCQTEFGAVESGAGAPDAKKWDWNSDFWRSLGAPWGGLHASAKDVGLYLGSFLAPDGRVLKPETARMMVRNHNPAGLESRGLAFDVAMESHCERCSGETFGHTGSTGTIAWADPHRDLICVVLTTLPARALPNGEHPRQLASNHIAAAL
ncbi:MAG: beta-lactamase family protein [Planctomycetaceae bacterium]|nr:beta-lactamase family protein [Planctomycetaceae bacterium]